ncbi:unnamed protein product [Closterium sp. NIES-53]
MSDLHGHPPTATTPTAATTATPTAASTATTKAPTPATTPTAATTSTASTTFSAAPTTTPVATATTPATLALAAAALRTSTSSPDVLTYKEVLLKQVNSEACGVEGEKVVPDRAKRQAAASRVSHCERVALSAVAGGAGAAPDVWSNNETLSLQSLSRYSCRAACRLQGQGAGQKERRAGPGVNGVGPGPRVDGARWPRVDGLALLFLDWLLWGSP